jgi:hypothetical protein
MELRAALEQAFEKDQTNEASPPATEATPQASPSSQAANEPSAPVEGTSDTPAATPSEPSKAAPEATPAVPVAPVAAGEPRGPEAPEASSQGSRVDRAPASWKGEAKAVWAALPLQARQEVVRRERDIERVQRDAAQDRQRVESIQQVIAPYNDLVATNYGGNPLQAVQSLLQVERVMTSAPTHEKAQFVANLIKHYKVDIDALDQFLSGQVAPEVQQVSQIDQLLARRLAPLEQVIQTLQQSREQASQTQVNMTVQAMAVDTTNYPHFEQVREVMADLIEFNNARGVYMSLPEAYTKAVRMDDTLSVQSPQAAAVAAHQAAQRAKGAAISVSGAPTAAGPSIVDPSNLRGVIAASLESTGGRL